MFLITCLEAYGNGRAVNALNYRNDWLRRGSDIQLDSLNESAYPAVINSVMIYKDVMGTLSLNYLTDGVMRRNRLVTVKRCKQQRLHKNRQQHNG